METRKSLKQLTDDMLNDMPDNSEGDLTAVPEIREQFLERIEKESKETSMNIAKKHREEMGKEWSEPPKSFEELKFGCPWGHGDSAGGRFCIVMNQFAPSNDCKEDNCAVLYWLRKMGKMK